jgi:hypothetical protein
MLANTIFDRLEAHWARNGHVLVATTSKQIWFDLSVDNETLGGRFGWCWPAPYAQPEHPDKSWMIGYCPELIADLIAHLEPDDREAYIDSIEYLSDMFIIDAAERYEDPKYRTEILATFEERFPGSAKLMDEVETRAIALGLVADEPGDVPKPHAQCSACGYMNPDGAKTCALCSESLT